MDIDPQIVTATGDSQSPDWMVRFARAHLTSQAHRAVQRVLACALDTWWSPEEVARATGEDRDEIDLALRQLNAAGIVDARAGGDDATYRWCLDMASLVEPTADVGDIDPVCGMSVSWSSPFVFEDASGVHRFCSVRCMTAARPQAVRKG